jgi:hypothetical protein
MIVNATSARNVQIWNVRAARLTARSQCAAPNGRRRRITVMYTPGGGAPRRGYGCVTALRCCETLTLKNALGETMPV